MTIMDLGLMNREPAFQIYAMLGNVDPSYLYGYEPGRVIILNQYDLSEGTGEILDGTEEKIGERDILYVPLYKGNVHGDTTPSDGFPERLECYDHNLDFIRNFGKRFGGVLVGNIGPEISFKHLFLYGEDGRNSVLRKTREFIKEVGDVVAGAGAKPCFPLIDWDLAADCYFGGAVCQDVVNDLNGTLVCFCGFNLFGLDDRKIPCPGDACWNFCPRQEESPWKELSEYISGFKESISGVNFIEGLDNGNDVALNDHGFSAGLCGIFPSLVQDRCSQ